MQYFDRGNDSPADHNPADQGVEFETDREAAQLAGIAGLSKQLVLWELWRHARPDQAVINHDSPVNNPSDIARRITSHPQPDQLDFAWLDGRCLQCSIGKDGVDLSGYNEKNGISGVALMSELRSKLSTIQEELGCSTAEAEAHYLAQTSNEITPDVKRTTTDGTPNLFDQLFPGNPFNGK